MPSLPNNNWQKDFFATFGGLSAFESSEKVYKVRLENDSIVIQLNDEQFRFINSN